VLCLAGFEFQLREKYLLFCFIVFVSSISLAAQKTEQKLNTEFIKFE